MIAVAFRNDDVNELTPELKRITSILNEQEVPVTHALEPANVTDETVEWLKGMKATHGRLIEITQHGWSHAWHGDGEFGKKRSYQEQLSDLRKGKERLEVLFGRDFFPMLTIPFGRYTRETVRAADALGFKVFCSHFNYRWPQRAFYFLGRVLGFDELNGHHVSYHLDYHPGTDLFQVDSSLSFIKEYLGRYTDDCVMEEQDWLMQEFERFARRTTVLVFLLHHRYHKDADSLDLVGKTVTALTEREDVVFMNYAEIYEKFRSPAIGTAGVENKEVEA